MDFQKWPQSVKVLLSQVKSPQTASVAADALDNQMAKMAHPRDASWPLSALLPCLPNMLLHSVVMVTRMGTVYRSDNKDLPHQS